MPALRKALRALQPIDAFRIDHETAPSYQRAAEQLCERAGVRCVVFGHTHLARDVDLGGGRRYLNTGTWANLLRVPDDVLREVTAERAEAHPALAAWLDQLRDNRLEPWFRPTYARLEFTADDRLIHACTRELLAGDPGAPGAP